MTENADRTLLRALAENLALEQSDDVDAILAVLEQAYQLGQPKWIKTSERLPEYQQPVWFVLNGEVGHGAFIPCRNPDFRWWNCERREPEQAASVSHWMPRPLPAAPEEK